MYIFDMRLEWEASVRNYFKIFHLVFPLDCLPIPDNLRSEQRAQLQQIICEYKLINIVLWLNKRLVNHNTTWSSLYSPCHGTLVFMPIHKLLSLVQPAALILNLILSQRNLPKVNDLNAEPLSPVNSMMWYQTITWLHDICKQHKCAIFFCAPFCPKITDSSSELVKELIKLLRYYFL